MPDTEKLNIHQKILKIADAAGVLQKTKSGYNYKYVPEEEIQAKVTACMQKYGVMLYHSIVQGTLRVQPYTYEKYDAKLKANKTVNEFIVTADSVYKWVNAETPGEYIEVPWALVGQMEDAYPDILRFMMFRKNMSIDIPFDESSLNEALSWARETVKEIRECWDFTPTCDEFFSENLCNHREYCESKI